MTTGRAARLSVVVIMAKQPVAGRTKTRLSPPLSPQEAATLYAALLDDTITLVAGVRGPRLAVAISPARALDAWQPRIPPGALLLPADGEGIGACLDDAIVRLSTLGFSRVIALNSDGPTLPADYLRQADALLEHHDVVVGPSDDGGYYLVGLCRPQPALFRDIAWSTSLVTTQTLARARSLGLSVALLPSWYDVDTSADLERLRVELGGLPSDALLSTRRFFSTSQSKRPVRPTRCDRPAQTFGRSDVATFGLQTCGERQAEETSE